MSIHTNRLDIKIEYEMLSNEFDFFKIETSDDYIKSGAFILDVPEMNKDIKSICFKSGKCFYALMNKNNENFYKIKRIIDSSDLSDVLTIKEVSIKDLKESVIIQLLINALGTYKNDFLKANNLTGHFYVFNPDWSIRGKYKNDDIIKQVICMEISISDGFVQLPVRTFTNTKLKSLITFKKKRFEEYPKYVYGANNTLRRKIQEDDSESFILRQLDNKKSDIAFLDISDIRSFEASKAGMLHKVIKLFNERYNGLAHIDLTTEELLEGLDYNNERKKQENKIITERFEDISIKIIDEVGSDVSARFCENIKQLIFDTYNESIKHTISIGKYADKEAINIAIIHNKQYYIDEEDAYNKSHNGVVQHITLEDFSDSAKYAIKTVINEALIKKDLDSGKISLFPWKELGYKENVSFGTMIKDDDLSERYFFMKIRPDGTFDFKEQELNLFEMTEYYDLVDIYETDNSSESIKGIIKDDKGNINIIRDTGWFTLPEIDLIATELLENNNKLRGKEARDKYLSSVLDLKIFKRDETVYYFSGVIGNGMRAKVENSSNIRSIEAYKDSEIILDDFLPLLDTTFVRNGQLTVLPYPFKYLREYIKGEVNKQK